MRAAVEEFWNDLKRGHFIDLQTRSLQLVMALRSNNLAVRSRLTMMLETTSLGSVLPVTRRAQARPPRRHTPSAAQL